MTLEEAKETDPFVEFISACADKTSAFLFATFQGQAMRFGDRNLLNITLANPVIPKYKKCAIEAKQVGHTFPLEVSQLLAKRVQPYVLPVWYRSIPKDNYAIILGGVELVGKRIR